jgi:hypothetical protein
MIFNVLFAILFLTARGDAVAFERTTLFGVLR